ncbi:putative siderophore iron transporter mirB [Hortaea werneckii]|nr:putative siderophore iron transporter mirB [Hortaea werneckii]KAI7322575.1 putative siderophore iron transporter mirB [Hortaea werneckii]
MPLRRPNWVLQRKDTDNACADPQPAEPNLAICLDPRDKTQVESTNDPEVQKPVEELKPSHGEAQHGVDVAEAITASWTRKYLVAAYILFWCIYCTNAFQSSITNNLTPYVTSSFELHSLTSTISVVASVMSGACYMPVAKILNVWGRPQGFAIMAAISTIGLIMMAVCRNVETYAAAQVFYNVGFSGLIFSIDVLTSDSSSLKDRGLAYAYTSTPYIITAFAGPKAAESFYEEISWRWGFGIFCIILPVVALPLFVLLKRSETKAKNLGLLERPKSGRSFLQSIWYYLVEFDILGIITLAGGLSLFLLPFSLADLAPHGWKTDYIIAMLVVGILLLISTYFVERFLAPKPFIPYHLLTNRTVLATCMLDATWQVAYYCWDSYFTSYLQVVYQTSISTAGYIAASYDIVAGVWLIGVGLLIRYTGRFKWMLWCAVSIYTLAEGLMIYFRLPHHGGVGFIVMCQCFIAIGGGTMTLIQQVAVLAVAEHGEFASMLALLGLFGYMGGAVGGAISGAIWTNTLPEELAKFLPESALGDLNTIYEDLDTQLSYAWGSPVREAIVHAYAVAQTRMLIAGTAVMVIGFICVALIRDINVKQIQQVKGVLF